MEIREGSSRLSSAGSWAPAKLWAWSVELLLGKHWPSHSWSNHPVTISYIFHKSLNLSYCNYWTLILLVNRYCLYPMLISHTPSAQMLACFLPFSWRYSAFSASFPIQMKSVFEKTIMWVVPYFIKFSSSRGIHVLFMIQDVGKKSSMHCPVFMLIYCKKSSATWQMIGRQKVQVLGSRIAKVKWHN